MARLFEFIRSPVLALLVTFALQALAFLERRRGVKSAKVILWIAASLAWLWVIVNPQLATLSWSLWFIPVVLSGLILGFVCRYANQALEPELPDVFLFRYSPLFTSERKKRITQTLTRCREYLGNLGFEFSLQKLPVGIGQRSAKVTPDSERLGSNEIVFQVNQVDDMVEITSVYLDYVMMRTMLIPAVPVWSIERQTRTLTAHDLAAYFNDSFWGHEKLTNFGSHWLLVFWEIRERFQEAFTDDLLAHMARSFHEGRIPFVADVLSDGFVQLPTAQMNQIIHSHLEVAEREVDNEMEKWPTILGLLRKRGLVA